jgi:hypothetical protein
MAEAAEQHTPIKDLDDALHYLTVELGYRKGVAIFMMNERYLDGDLLLEKQECVRDGEPYGDAVPIDAKFGYIELDPQGRVRVAPRTKLWREARYRIAEACDVRAIWSPHPPAAHATQDQRPTPDPAPEALPVSDPSKRVYAKNWVPAEAIRLKKDNKIPLEVYRRPTDFARFLEGRMRAAKKTNELLHPVGWQYIKNHLHKWGIWPIESIKK